ncbi:MAG: pyridoxal-phosphate dependent enzyme [Bacteroidota bacterium]
MEPAPFIIPLQAIHDGITNEYGINLFMLRTDLNHTYISGNKLFKLKYNLLEAKKKDCKTILTFGGAFSNHIAATAAAGKEYGFSTIGIIRGEASAELNPTLEFAVACGMQLQYVSRTLYRNKEELYNYINQQFPEKNIYIIPEGGSNELGIMGCQEITQHITTDFNYVCCPCGTGVTMSGIILSLKEKQQSIGFQILKADGYIKNEVSNWLQTASQNNTIIKSEIPDKTFSNNWSINEDYHFGGYARVKSDLTAFIKKFKNSHNIELDYIYTGKMMFGIYDLIKKNHFKRGETILAIHTGGLQGNAGMESFKKI